jgi:hypothetical protein
LRCRLSCNPGSEAITDTSAGYQATEPRRRGQLGEPSLEALDELAVKAAFGGAGTGE